MSKSVGNVIDPFTLADHYGVDQMRYFFLREVPFGQDGNYSHEAIVNRINSDLANDIGNLAQRSLSMIAKNCEGVVPLRGKLLPQDTEILDQAEAALSAARRAMESYAPHQALAEIFRVVSETNRYFASEEPWSKKKTDPDRMKTILYVTAETLRRLALPLQPFIPQAASKLLDLLGVGPDEREFHTAGALGALKEGAPLPPPAPIFPRYIEEAELDPAAPRPGQN